MKNINDFCRKNRSRSISPSVSFDHADLNEEEKHEKNFYSAIISDMIKELFTSFDDLIKYINYNLLKKVKETLKDDLSEQQVDSVCLYIYFLDSFWVF